MVDDKGWSGIDGDNKRIYTIQEICTRKYMDGLLYKFNQWQSIYNGADEGKVLNLEPGWIVWILNEVYIIGNEYSWSEPVPYIHFVK